MDQLIEIVSGFILGIGIVSIYAVKLKNTLKAVGELLTELGDALDDGKITKSEIADIVEDAKNVLGLFKK